MTEPTTAAGRELLRCVVDGEWRSDWSEYDSLEDVALDIERQAVAAYRADLAAKVRDLRIDTGLTYECPACHMRWRYTDQPEHFGGCALTAVHALIEGEPR